MVHIDARPSDAIALAVRAKCPVFVSGGALEALVDMNDESEEKAAETEIKSTSAAFPSGDKGEDAKERNEKKSGGASDDELDRFKRLVNDLEI